MRRFLIVVLLAAATLGSLSAPAGAASNGLAGCRLVIAAQDPALSRDEEVTLGGAAMERLIPARQHIASLRKLLLEKPLARLIDWCEARYPARQLHSMTPSELLAQLRQSTGNAP
jgi:hypothetical protein